MARIEKHASGIRNIIKHNIREFPDGVCHSNPNVDPQKSQDNYSLIKRGNTAKEIDTYRKEIESECFKYKRKNLIRANEVVCTLPADCPPEQERAFFEESYKYICSTLPMGERCVFLAEVHADEGTIIKDGITVVQGARHLHVMYVPAVPDTKHPDFQYKLCSDDLTKRSILKNWHTNYQSWLDAAGVTATVKSGVTSGAGISVQALKELTKETGLSLTEIKSLQYENAALKRELEKAQDKIRTLEHAATRSHSWGNTENWGNHTLEYEKEIEQ